MVNTVQPPTYLEHAVHQLTSNQVRIMSPILLALAHKLQDLANRPDIHISYSVDVTKYSISVIDYIL